MVKKKFFYRKCLSSIAAVTVMASAVLHFLPVSYAFASGQDTTPVSKLVETDNGAYVEYKGVP